MAENKKVKFPWCEKEGTPKVVKDKSEYGNLIIRTCAACGKIIASYLVEKQRVLEKVRSFSG
jgi:hypothetical protein